jgi:phage/conjugal plasmid C-4 type zinc finger TraR family protein
MADAADMAFETIEHDLSVRLSALALSESEAADPECEDCGLDIPQKRREAAPWAKTCIDCQGIREMRQRRTASM